MPKHRLDNRVSETGGVQQFAALDRINGVNNRLRVDDEVFPRSLVFVSHRHRDPARADAVPPHPISCETAGRVGVTIHDGDVRERV